MSRQAKLWFSGVGLPPSPDSLGCDFPLFVVGYVCVWVCFLFVFGSCWLVSCVLFFCVVWLFGLAFVVFVAFPRLLAPWEAVLLKNAENCVDGLGGADPNYRRLRAQPRGCRGFGGRSPPGCDGSRVSIFLECRSCMQKNRTETAI